MAKKLNDASIATITSLNPAHFINVINNSTGEIQKITTADAATELAGGGVLTYVAILNQSGTGAPTASIALNTLGVTITFARTTTGQYTATASGSVFTSNKTVVFATNGSPNNGISAARFSATVINIESGTFSTPADSAIVNASFKIEVYP